MNDFREQLVVTYESDEGYGHHRRFKGLEIGPLTLSVQASEFHYCSPRETVAIGWYYEWECALWNDERWLSPDQDPEIFAGLDAANFWESGDYPVAGFVPTTAVQALYDRLAERAALEETE